MTPAAQELVAALTHLRAMRQMQRRALRNAYAKLRAYAPEAKAAGIPARRLSDNVKGLLRDAGWTDEQISLVPVSAGSIEKILARD